MLDRHQTVLRMREQGATFPVIADVLGVTAGRASAIYKRAIEVRAEEDIGLSRHSILILRRYRGSIGELAALAEENPAAAVTILLRELYCNRRHAEPIVEWLRAGNLGNVDTALLTFEALDQAPQSGAGSSG